MIEPETDDQGTVVQDEIVETLELFIERSNSRSLSESYREVQEERLRVLEEARKNGSENPEPRDP